MNPIRPPEAGDAGIAASRTRDFGMRQAWLQELERARQELLGHASASPRAALQPEAPPPEPPPMVEALPGGAGTTSAAGMPAAGEAPHATAARVGPEAPMKRTGGVVVPHATSHAAQGLAAPMREPVREPLRIADSHGTHDAHAPAIDARVPQASLNLPGDAARASARALPVPAGDGSSDTRTPQALRAVPTLRSAVVGGAMAETAARIARPVTQPGATAAASVSQPAADSPIRPARAPAQPFAHATAITSTAAVTVESEAASTTTLEEAPGRESAGEARERPAPGEPPAKRSLHLASRGDEASLWLRDATLEPAAAAGLVGRIAAEVARAGKRLAALTLNGRTLFNRTKGR